LNYAFHLPAPWIVGALALDLAFGDPAWMPHPVRLMGWLIDLGDRRLHQGVPSRDLMTGGLVALATIAVSALAAWLVIVFAESLGWFAEAIAATTIASTTLALRGLDDAARQVENDLRSGRENEGRMALRALVGRDPEKLDRAGMIRAAIESVAENTSDGFVAPLLFLVAAGPVGAISYKAINTLDSMIGYRDPRYNHFGRFAARLDDYANLLPSRLTALCIAAAATIVTQRGRASLRIRRTDGWKHQSPNAGHPEAAMAGALGVELGGDAYYSCVLESGPRFGLSERAIEVQTLRQARTIMWIASGCASMILIAGRAALSKLFLYC
jgi:adenosylcobinamide-phosphate synthase